jgi:hypothetical protein
MLTMRRAWTGASTEGSGDGGRTSRTHAMNTSARRISSAAYRSSSLTVSRMGSAPPKTGEKMHCVAPGADHLPRHLREVVRLGLILRRVEAV